MSHANARFTMLKKPVPSSKCGHSGGRAVFTTVSLILSTTMLVVWLNQHALMLYWQQRYQTDAPWVAWQGHPLWDFGGRLYRAVDTALTTFIQQLSSAYVEDDESAVTSVAIVTLQKPVFPKNFLQGSQHSAFINRVDVDKRHDTTGALNIPPLDVLPLAMGNRVLFIGDSLMQGGAPHVKRTLLTQWGIYSLDLSRQSTGLRHPAFFNWPKTLDMTLRQHTDITVVVVFLGPNAPWGLPADEHAPASTFKSEQWERRYRARIANILHIAEQHQAHVIWVGPPNTRDVALSQSMQYLRSLYQSEVENAGEIYLDANAILQYSATSYTDTWTDSTGGRKIRTADGVHFTTTGQRILAEAIMGKLQAPDVPGPFTHTGRH